MAFEKDSDETWVAYVFTNVALTVVLMGSAAVAISWQPAMIRRFKEAAEIIGLVVYMTVKFAGGIFAISFTAPWHEDFHEKWPVWMAIVLSAGILWFFGLTHPFKSILAVVGMFAIVFLALLADADSSLNNTKHG